MREAVIVSAVRTPVGRANKGSLANVRPEDLGALAVKEAIARVDGLEPGDVDDLIIGCAMPEGEQGWNVARQIVFLAGLCAAGLVAGYVLLPHVQIRIDRYLDPASGDSFQVDTSLNAFSNGGLLGRGPGEGVVKNTLPDAHADFIFAVVGEEFGLIVCLIIVALFAFVVLRGFARLMQQENLFVMLAAGGLLTQFGLQAAVNMAVTLHLVPTKGMTLPFISYGGSSMLALALTMGMVIGLTRRRSGAGQAL